MKDAAPRALAHYGLTLKQLTPLEGGLINHTFRVDAAEGVYVLQALNPIFKAEVNEDIEAITRHLEKKGMPTPLLVRTKKGGLSVNLFDGSVWRLMTYVPGKSFSKLSDGVTAAEAGALVGRFHLAVSDLPHEFRFKRQGVHDTGAHLRVLSEALVTHHYHRHYPRIAPLGESIVQAAETMWPLDTQQTRLAHGDLKVSNLLFDAGSGKGLCLVDLDTLSRMPLSHEMGDAWRSWCNPAGEDEPQSRFDLGLFEASARAYLDTVRTLITEQERQDLVLGIATIALELAARFCADALRESYFGWDEKRFPDRSTHNWVRAQSQWSLHRSVMAQRDEAEAIVRSL